MLCKIFCLVKFCHAEYVEEDKFQAETNSSKCTLCEVSVRVSCIQYARGMLCI